MIGIIDYGMGNILSVKNAFEVIGADISVCSSPEDIRGVDRIVLPGVGAFGDCITNLSRAGFVNALNDAVLGRRIPILGICLGMQVMARKGWEGGEWTGLGWFDAEVVRLTPSDPGLRIPHVGWNNIVMKQSLDVFAGLPESPDVYFVHSYYMKCRDNNDVSAVFHYGGEFTAAVIKDNIIATQFHPEKSQDYGLKILENFMRWEPKC